MVNLTCPNDGKGTDLQYELVVHAEIYSPEQDEAPEIPKVDEKDTTQLAVSTVGEVRSTVYSTAINLIDKTTKGGFPATTKMALTGFLTAPFLGIDILLSSKKEGMLQATITSTTATLATTYVAGFAFEYAFGLGLAIPFVCGAIPSVVVATVTATLVASIVGFAFNYIISDKLDEWYDLIEQKFIDVSINDRTLIFDTSLTEMNDIKSLIDLTVNDGKHSEYFEKIAVRQTLDERTITYIVQKGDTIYDICEKYNMDENELLELNPWLDERYSGDRSFVLIKPCEKIRIPTDDYVELIDIYPDLPDIFDEVYVSLKLQKGDGTVYNLDEASVQSINLEIKQTFEYDEFGNKQISIGSWTDKDNNIKKFAEYLFSTDTSETISQEWLEETVCRLGFNPTETIEIAEKRVA